MTLHFEKFGHASMKNKSRAGFTLLELLVVVAIIGILAAIALPQFLRYSARTKRIEAFIALNAIYKAEQVYFASYDTYMTELDLSLLNLPELDRLQYYKNRSYVTNGPSKFLIALEAQLDQDLFEDMLIIQQCEGTSCIVPGMPSGIPAVFADDIVN